jgi:hypothetical protein
MKRIAVYDNGGETFDRYTIVLLKAERFYNDKYYVYVGAAKDIGPQGFYQHGEFSFSYMQQIRKDNHSLGKKIPFKSLPTYLQNAINQER